ncbi:MAG TPA: polysaccharide biosynthesis tyrosine autokinase [Gaiellaceae bacterium]|nr:polysaccharide biosynthesis tyrosine autokinase [Gaiellaceae bacterium]
MSLSDYIAILRRRKAIVLLALVLVPAAALAVSLLQSPLHEAEAKVVLHRQSLASTLAGTTDPTIFQDAERVVQTQAELARVAEVADRALRTVPEADLTVDELLESSTVSPEPNVDILLFRVRHEDPRTAGLLARAYAHAYTDYRADVEVDALERARADVRSELAALRRAGATDAELQSLLDKEQQLVALEALQTGNASVVDETAEADQVQPRPRRNLALGVVLGLGLGLLLVLLADALDTRIRTSDELAEALGSPLLGRLPRPSRSARRLQRPSMITEPGAPTAEAFRMLRTNIDFANLDVGARTIMITSAVEEEGKSTTAANLAVAYALAGRRVVLLDLDLRRPSLHRFFRREVRPGVVDVVIGDVSLGDALVAVPVLDEQPLPVRGGNGRSAALNLLPAGPTIPSPGEFVGSPQFAALLEAVREDADIVLLDAPPILRVGDAMTMSTMVDAFLLVTRLKALRRPMVSDLRRHLNASPIPVLGFVVTDADTPAGYGYGYGGDDRSEREAAERLDRSPETRQVGGRPAATPDA